MLTTLYCMNWKKYNKNIRKQVESTGANVNSELQVLHVGTNAMESVHEVHWYGHATHHQQTQ